MLIVKVFDNITDYESKLPMNNAAIDDHWRVDQYGYSMYRGDIHLKSIAIDAHNIESRLNEIRNEYEQPHIDAFYRILHLNTA